MSILTIEDLINAYLNIANTCLQKMQTLTLDHPINAIRKKIIPPQGYLDKETTYSAHGVGFFFKNPKWEINIDLDRVGKCGGFDTWRLATFAKSMGIHQKFSLQTLQTDLNILLKNKKIYINTEYPCKGLLKVKENTYESTIYHLLKKIVNYFGK